MDDFEIVRRRCNCEACQAEIWDTENGGKLGCDRCNSEALEALNRIEKGYKELLYDTPFC
jgi:Zn finger protein HypA/HybF involved in hydrogenase expression